jgi:uncharacterized membrane protein YgdD (TMEM256/DUF423 family)
MRSVSPGRSALKSFFLIGCISAAVSTIAGAFGAHMLRGTVAPEMADVFDTGCRYQMYHALALMAISIASRVWVTSSDFIFRLSGTLFIAGTILFSGSLYVYTLTETTWIAAVTPAGGILFVAGWVSLLFQKWT